MPLIFPTNDITDLADVVAQRFVDLIAEIQHTHGSTHGDDIARVVVTGGSSGLAVLKNLAQRGDEIDWSSIEFFFGDERNVELSDDQSNEGQARSQFFDQLDIPDSRIHGYGLSGAQDLEQRAKDYAETLSEFAPSGFDLHLAGLGEDGHFNSLFPNHSSSQQSEDAVIVVNDSPKPPKQRLSLSLSTVGRADRLWFLAAGEAKADAVARLVPPTQQHYSGERIPAARVTGNIDTFLFADKAALSRVENTKQ